MQLPAKLVYWSQMRGKRRTGPEEHERWKEIYKVHKHLTICNENIQKEGHGKTVYRS